MVAHDNFGTKATESSGRSGVDRTAVLNRHPKISGREDACDDTINTGEIMWTHLVASAATVTAEATASPIFTWFGFVDRQNTTIVLLSIQGGDRLLCLTVTAHLDEPEALALPRSSVVDYYRAIHGSMLVE
jgi:hypothetical protein